MNLKEKLGSKYEAHMWMRDLCATPCGSGIWARDDAGCGNSKNLKIKIKIGHVQLAVK